MSDITEMKNWFDYRTGLHIGLVCKYLQEIIDLNLPYLDNNILESEMVHDKSKFSEPEYTPYLHITWKYKMQKEGVVYNPPEGIDIQAATFHHIKVNKHHPEYWDDTVTSECVNPNNRDKPSGNLVNASKMPGEYIACMIADWLAMSEEKNTNVYDWISMNVGKRWHFTFDQKVLINTITDKVMGK